MLSNNPYIPQFSIPSFLPQAPLQQVEIQKVTGEESARAYPLAPNSSIILLDSNNPLIWVVTTDASGYKTVNPFTITPYTPEKAPSAEDINERLKVINDRLEKLEERTRRYGQSNNGSTWKGKPGNSNNFSNVRNGQGIQESSGNVATVESE